MYIHRRLRFIFFILIFNFFIIKFNRLFPSTPSRLYSLQRRKTKREKISKNALNYVKKKEQNTYLYKYTPTKARQKKMKSKMIVMSNQQANPPSPFLKKSKQKFHNSE